ncbi:hypothetical protein F4778DRAFT_800383 [Xylariomycetidae sp. FL2044]|nr:hypothetical protein F4778DRAFT_800383 [Xylariomycetidae sp. FL2044]
MSYLQSLRASRTNRWLHRILRVLQFLGSVIALGMFSDFLWHIRRRHDYTIGQGAVEGILAASTLYTLSVMILSFLTKHNGPKPIRWFIRLMDVLFIGGWIAVAVLTRPNYGSAGPYGGGCRRATSSRSSYPAGLGNVTPRPFRRGGYCDLPYGPFVIGIIMPILLALSALLHPTSDDRRYPVHRLSQEEKALRSSHGTAPGNGHQDGADGHRDQGSPMRH